MDTPMNINDQQAKESLEMIQQTTEKTKKALASHASPWLILWGALWVAAYTTCHFYGEFAGYIFALMGIIGTLGSGILIWLDKTKGPVKTDSKNPTDKKILWIWFILSVYVVIWIFIMSPSSGLQTNVFIITAVMFAYIIMGVFYEVPLLTIIGIFVTGLSVLAYYLFPAYYCLTIAIFGGGTLLGTGIYIRLKWR